MTTVGGTVSQANLKIVEKTLAGMAEKEKGKRKEKSSDKGKDVKEDEEKEEALKSGDRLKGKREEERESIGLCCDSSLH